ncbi:MAG TPA: DNA-packaging protein [Lachnospiraceae bacterium]|nr:DNA-packaging protein [Lachnospiraceae bacterium]
MRRDEKIDRLRNHMLSEDPDDVIDEAILEEHLDLAGDVILNQLYQFNGQGEGKEVPRRYEGLQIRMAIFSLNKIGAEGQVQHIENGIHRNWGSSDYPETMLKEITPYCKVIV